MYQHPFEQVNGIGFTLSRSPVPDVPPVPVHTAWHVDDIPPQADNTELLTWQPRIGVTPLTKDGSAASGLYRTNTGLPSVEFVGANSSRMIADAIAGSFSGNDVPLFIYVFAVATTAADDQTLWSFGDSASNNAFVRMRVDTDGVDADRVVVFRADNSGASTSNTSLTPGVTDVTEPLGFTCRFTGTALDYALGKRHIRSVASALGDVTLDRFTVACFRRSGSSATNFYSGRIRAILVSQTALTDAQIAQCDDWARGAPPGGVPDIGCAGDSITVGYGDFTGLGGYRKGLWTHIREAGYLADMAGSDGNGHGNWPRRQACATNGHTIQEIRADVNALFATVTPRLVILLAGTNNVMADQAAAIDEYLGLLSDMVTAAPGVRIAVTTIPPNANATFETNAQTFNARLQGTGAFAGIGAWETFEAQSPGVLAYGWDIRTALPVWDAEYFFDNGHPNEAGYAAILNHPTAGLWQAVEPIIATW